MEYIVSIYNVVVVKWFFEKLIIVIINNIIYNGYVFCIIINIIGIGSC